MTQLLASIERHLDRVRAIEAASIPDTGAGPDLAHHEATLVALFERAEARGKKPHPVDLQQWLDGELDLIVEPLHWDLLATFREKFDASTRQQLIDWALAQDSGLAELSTVSAPSEPMQKWMLRREPDLDDVGRGWPLHAESDFPWRIVSR
ncbi:MAG TPA: hypothetical protein VM869_02170, partial [Enhygromyxa sp.]|nr:hypothetical protein [Enhygromyxa sp.]